MKKDAYFSTCERMYVVEQRTIESIISEIPVAEKTVRNWKKEGNWDAKRSELLQQETSFASELYEFARKLMRYVSLEMDNPDAEVRAKLDSMTRLLRVLPATQKFEAASTAERKAASDAERKVNQNGLSEEALRKIEQQAAIL